MIRDTVLPNLRPCALGLLAGLPAGIAACSLALDLDDKIACSADADCQYTLGPGTCEDGFCVPPAGASATEGSSSGEPTTSATTLTTSATEPTTTSPDSSGSESSTTGPVGCTLNSECETDQFCGAGGSCTDLLTTECQIIHWPGDAPADRDNVVFIGSIMPTGEPFTNLVQPLENAVQLAVDDFNDTTTLQGDRRIAWIGCNDAAGPTASQAAATHLVDTVGVPAIVGPIFSEAVLDVAADISVPGGAFLITPTATAMSIASLDDQDLVWRTIPGDVYQSNALVDRMIDLDAISPVSNLLVLAKDDAYGNGILAAILDDLTMSLPTAAIYTDTYPDPTTFATQDELLAAYGAVLAQAATDEAAMPYYTHVLFIGTSEIQVLLYSFLGVVWDGAGGDPMPLFTVTHGAVPEMQRFIEEIGPETGTAALVPLKPLIESRLQGTSPVVLNPVNFEAFSIRYRIAFNDEQPLSSSALSYDATLSTLFAMCTIAADADVTGAAIAAAMPNLVDADGEFISFSGSDLSFIGDARNTLATEGGSVDLQGVSGELQWDLATGDVRADVWGWDVIDMSGDGSMPTSAPTRIYLLDPDPATDGTWMPIPG
jgi:branched-chain amino acid transport system substrate-binding protein